MTAIWLLTLLIGVLLGTVIGFLISRGRETGARIELAARASAADERARAADQRAELFEEQLADRFQVLSAQAMDASTRRFLELAEGRLSAANAKATGELETRKAAVESLVSPLKETLTRVETALRESDAQRQASHAALTEQVTIARQSSEELKTQTQALVTALRRPEARGRWGEMQLRRVAELAGMIARCDFDEQVSVDSDEGLLRPDMVVRLAGGKNIVVDSKVSLAAYLEAAEAPDEEVREARLRAHARHLREHVDRLAGKAYWSVLSPSPEFVVLFIPGEAFLAPALEYDPALLEHAVERKVHIATPTTLVTMLRTAQYAWQQEALSQNARAVFDLGRELYERISRLGPHVDKLGKALTSAVTTYNQTVGSLESRVLVTARRLNQLGLVDGTLDEPNMIEENTRALSAPELTASAAAQSATASGSGQPEITAAEPDETTGAGPGEITAAEPEDASAGPGQATAAEPEVTGAGPGQATAAGPGEITGAETSEISRSEQAGVSAAASITPAEPAEPAAAPKPAPLDAPVPTPAGIRG